MKEIYLDFDGTVVEHAYPETGKANPHAKTVITKLHALGYRIILNTMRAEFEDKSLDAAIQYLELIIGIDIEYFTPHKIHPLPWHADNLAHSKIIFIDDIADGIPTIPTLEHGDMVDWITVENQLKGAGILY